MGKQKTHIIQDKGEVAIDFPEKFYMGSFSRDGKFEARAENDGLFIKLTRGAGEKREVQVHLHHHLLADILSEWAVSLRHQPAMDPGHRENLCTALKQVEKALGKTKS